MISLIWKLLAACFIYDIFIRFREISKTKMNQNPNNINAYNNINNPPPKEENIKDIDLTLDEDDEDDNLLPNKKRVKKPTKKILIKYDKKSYQKFFDQFQKDLMGNFTEFKVEGEEYPINPTKKWLSKYTFISQMSISMLLFGLSKFKDSLKFIPSVVFDTIEKSKWMFVIGNFLFHQWLNNFLGTTGAFEVYYNDIVLYSKLSKKILPKIKDIKSAISLLE